MTSLLEVLYRNRKHAPRDETETGVDVQVRTFEPLSRWNFSVPGLWRYEGSEISCGHCGSETRVWHFFWIEKVCPSCNTPAKKHHWFREVGK